MSTIGEQILLLFVYMVFSAGWLVAGWFLRRKYDKMQKEKDEEIQRIVQEYE